MPELPEVETIARGLRAHLLGGRIVGAEVHHPAVLRGSIAEFLEAILETRIETITRVGKFLVLGLSRDSHSLALIIHLGMTGQLKLAPRHAPLEKHTHAVFFLDGQGRELRYRDIRRFGRIHLLPAEQVPAYFAALGREPFEITPQEFCAHLRGRKAPIKSLLLNQTILRGLGNIYADESLFVARIHPRRRAGTLSAEEVARLLRAIRRVLARAIAHEGSSVSNYLNVEGATGNYQRYHRVYRKNGLPCPRCGERIRRLIIAGRSSHFCPCCQARRRQQPRASISASRQAAAPSRTHA